MLSTEKLLTWASVFRNRQSHLDVGYVTVAHSLDFMDIGHPCSYCCIIPNIQLDDATLGTSDSATRTWTSMHRENSEMHNEIISNCTMRPNVAAMCFSERRGP